MGRHTARRTLRDRRLILPVLTVTIMTIISVAALADGAGKHAGSAAPARSRHTSASPRTARVAVGHRPVAVSLAVAPWLRPVAVGARGHLRPGSDPSVLPSSLLIVDKFNNRLIVVDQAGRIRWQFPRPGDLTRGQTFRIPDDAFFSPNGRYIIATQEDQAVITLIDVARHRIAWRYGVPGHPGMTANHLSNPDDAMVMPNGDVFTADIKNCRLLIVAPGAHVPLHVIGTTTSACRHDPPMHWGSPNGVFPTPDGHYLVTEINGDWINEIGLNGRVLWSTHAPGVAYPSDTNQITADRYLTVDYSSPGQVVVFDRSGRRLWHWTGQGANALDHPSLALPLPNGDFVVNDDFNHRVVVIDPRTNRIVWQYGVTGIAGGRPGYLNNPDGIDLVPPHSFLATHASTMGTWPT